MNQFLDAYTLIFLVLAIVVFLRLRSVLGRRTGHERPPFDPYAAKPPATKPATGNDNVVSLPRRAEGEGRAGAGAAELTGIEAVGAADPTFDETSFLNGARLAYEMIVTAFAEGDRKALKPLLARDVHDGFVAAIADRESRGEHIESKFVGIDAADIVDAGVKGRQASVTVKFVSELITATIAKDGSVVDGDPNQITQVTDVWTFARDVSSRDPNWKLVATEAAE